MQPLVYIDRELGLRTTFKVAQGSTVFQLKGLIAQDDLSGATSSENIELRTTSGVVVDNGYLILEESEFDLC